jgi:hypothetical protein
MHAVHSRPFKLSAFAGLGGGWLQGHTRAGAEVPRTGAHDTLLTFFQHAYGVLHFDPKLALMVALLTLILTLVDFSTHLHSATGVNGFRGEPPAVRQSLVVSAQASLISAAQSLFRASTGIFCNVPSATPERNKTPATAGIRN